MTFVSVIIPAHEMNSIFESVLLHLQPTIQTYSDYEVIVVSDNCPQVVQYVAWHAYVSIRMSLHTTMNLFAIPVLLHDAPSALQ